MNNNDWFNDIEEKAYINAVFKNGKFIDAKTNKPIILKENAKVDCKTWSCSRCNDGVKCGMASRNSRKVYVKNGYYHVYNRGVEKRNIFADDLDYRVFLKYLKEYLEPKDERALFEILGDKTIDWSEKDKALKLLKLNNFSAEIELIAFCLMPNHFHLLIKQNKWNSIDSFTNSILTRYASYFNRRHKRVGKLFQDVYKAVLVNSESQLLHLSRYIHQNPTKLKDPVEQHQYAYTSLPEFLNKRQTGWINPQTVLSYFSKNPSNNSYGDFVSQPSDNELISNILIEDPA